MPPNPNLLTGVFDIFTGPVRPCDNQIPAKTNEIPTLKDWLRDLDLRGTFVSADALNTQTATADHIVGEKQADYLLVVKANQPKLFDKLVRLSHAPTLRLRGCTTWVLKKMQLGDWFSYHDRVSSVPQSID